MFDYLEKGNHANILKLNRWIKYMEESKTFEVKQIPIEIVNAS